jgi:hypothetical protein
LRGRIPTRRVLRGVWSSTTWIGVELDVDAPRSRSPAAAATARVRAVLGEGFDGRGACGRGAVEFALDVSGWAAERGEVFLRFLGCAKTSAFCGSEYSAGPASVGRTIELEPEVRERGESDSGEAFDQAHARGAPVGMEIMGSPAA